MNAQKSESPNWEEIRIAYQVAKLGTLSAAAAELGVHHATVIRQVDALEARLGVKLFQRHPRGYTATEAGRDLLTVAGVTEDNLKQLFGRIKGRGAAVQGELVVTMLTAMIDQMTPILAEFMALHPDVRVTVIGEERTLRLEYGEAHVALRAGKRPQDPDNVVQELSRQAYSLFAHQSYAARHGIPASLDDLKTHRFVGAANRRVAAPFVKWMNAHVADEQTIYRVNSQQGMEAAINNGIGIGFMSVRNGQDAPELVQMVPEQPEWQTSMWLVTHRDLHRTAKVQAITSFLKAHPGL